MTEKCHTYRSVLRLVVGKYDSTSAYQIVNWTKKEKNDLALMFVQGLQNVSTRSFFLSVVLNNIFKKEFVRNLTNSFFYQ